MNGVLKNIRHIGVILGVFIALAYLHINVNAAEAHTSIDPFQQKDQVIYGKLQPNQEAHLQFKNQLYTVKSNSKGAFSFPLKQAVGNESIVLFQKDKDGYEQKTITYSAIDVLTDKVGTNEIAPPSYIGIQDNQFVFESRPSVRIYVIYEGKTYSGVETLRVNKNKSTELKFFAQDDSQEFGKKSKVVVKQINDFEQLNINSFDLEGSRIKGIAWPYAQLKVLNDDGEIRGWIDVNQTGEVDANISLSSSDVADGTNLTVQDVRSSIPLYVQKIHIPAFKPDETKPVYFSHNVSDNSVLVKTFKDAQVMLDQQLCPAMDSLGTFTCTLSLSENPTHELTMTPPNGSAVSRFFDTEFNENEFPLSLNTPLSSGNAELIGQTLPNKEFKIEASNGLSLVFNSDDKGIVKLSLPKAFNLNYRIFLKYKGGTYKPIKYLDVSDDRKIPKPVLKAYNGDLVIDNPMYGKDAHLMGELLIEKSNGEWNIEHLKFDQWMEELKSITIENIDDGDRYTLTLYKTQDDPHASVHKGIFKRIIKPEFDLKKSDATTLVGRTEPLSSVTLTLPIFRSYESSYVMQRTFKTTSDTKGNFKISLDKKTSLQIDYSANITSNITSKDKLKKDYYYQTIGDKTSPIIQLDSKYIADSDPAVNLLSDDRLKKIELKYFSGNKMISEKSISPVKYLTFIYSSKHQSTYKENKIDKIMVKGTNVSQQVSSWVSFKVTNTDFPSIKVQKIYIGDRYIKGKTSNKTPFEIIANDYKYTVKPLKDGTFKLKLKNQLKKGTKSIKIVIRNDIDKKKTIIEKVFTRK